MGLLLFLTGCLFKTTDELYAVPQASEEYINLQAAIDQAKGTADYAAPLLGRNTQTVQLVDLDNDGTQEAVTFFRDASAEKPLKIYIFRQIGEDAYEVKAVIEGDGTAIESINYCDLDGGGSKEILVSWRLSTSVHTLVAYSLSGGVVTELMRTGYSYYVPVDVDGDGSFELLLLQIDTAGNAGTMEYYGYKEGAMALRSSAPLSDGLTGVRTYQTGLLRGNVPALFVTSEYGENRTVTDIISIDEGKVRNLTRNEESGRSSEIFRFYTGAEPADINGDGILEVPQPQAVHSYSKTTSADDYWVLKWRQFDQNGVAWPVFTTYHNYNNYDRWYLVLPDHWEGNITLARRDSISSIGERAVVFSYWAGNEDVEPQPFLTIYKLTGTNRASRSKLGSRFILKTQSDAIYAAEFTPCDWDCGLDEEGLRARFDLIRTVWSQDG